MLLSKQKSRMLLSKELKATANIARQRIIAGGDITTNGQSIIDRNNGDDDDDDDDGVTAFRSTPHKRLNFEW